MSSDLKPRIQLRLVANSPDESSQPTEIIEKKLKTRGRPRKNPITSELETETELSENISNENVEIIDKKRGRKKKYDTTINITEKIPVASKSYIVQLKVKSSDLEKIQQQFITKTQQVGYKPLIATENVIEDSKPNFDEYYKLLNSLEMPMASVTDFNRQKITTSFGSTLKAHLPDIPNLYQTSILPILPGNVSIRLFNQQSDDTSTNNQTGGSQLNFRKSSNLILSQFNHIIGTNHKWPETSNYPCWNCDIIFEGTPIGIVDKEVNGDFYCSGNCCDFPCAARYLAERENTIDFWSKYSLLCLLYQKAFNLPPNTKVPIAPPREALIKYGGKYSYETYHSLHKHNKTAVIYKLPLIPVMLHIEEISRTTNINNIIEKNLNQLQTPIIPLKNTKVNRFIPVDPARQLKAESNWKLKTNERLQSNYTLDNCLHSK